MANLYAEIQGARGPASRLGHSHIWGHIRGWEVGVYVEGHHDKETKTTTMRVYATSGSNGRKGKRLIAEFTNYDQPLSIVEIGKAIAPI